MKQEETRQPVIISRSSFPFPDREQAGRELADELGRYRFRKAVVLGIPRGGMVVAREIATELVAELDIVLSHKLPTPGHPELAMGAVTEDGSLFLNKTVVQGLGVEEAEIQDEQIRQMAEIKRRVDLFRPVRPKVNLKGRIVIVTDDGIATGATMQAALWAVRTEQPVKLIAAIPVGPEHTIQRLAGEVDEMICLRCPPGFSAVGQFYRQFHPVQDAEVLQILEEERLRSA